MTTPLHQWRAGGVACAAVLLVACSRAPLPEIRTAAGLAQGTTYSLQWIGGADVDDVAAAVEQELERIDALLSNYRSDSTLEQFNAARNLEPIDLPAELMELLALAKRVHAASNGCFDPTVRPLVRAWGFDGDTPGVPDSATIAAARASVGLDKLELTDSGHVRKSVAELEVDMSSIGQGYTAGRLATVLEKHGSTAYLAEIGGEIVTLGTKPDGTSWRVGLENPTDSVIAPALQMPTDVRATVVTSGSYRHFLAVDGRRYGHVIDPRSGWPVEHGLLSVTVVGPDAATAAAWGTALLCLGPDEATGVADREGVAALFWLDRDGDGQASPELSQAFVRQWQDRLEDRSSR